MSLNLYIQIELGEVYIILYFLGSVWGAPWWKDVALLKSMKNETSLRKKKDKEVWRIQNLSCVPYIWDELYIYLFLMYIM